MCGGGARPSFPGALSRPATPPLTAGVAEGAKSAEETNCLHFLGAQPLRGAGLRNCNKSATLKNNHSHENPTKRQFL